MPRNPKDWDDLDDFDADDEDDDPEDWTVEQWEADLKRRDERDRKFAELLDKYGHDEAGFRKAMEELGLGKIHEDLDRRAEEQQAQPEDDGDGEEKIDKILRASREANQDFDQLKFRHPLGQAVYELTLMVFKSIDGHDEIDSRDHPLVLYSGAFLDAQDGLAGMGYMNEWDDDIHVSPPKNLKIAVLKRTVKHLVKGLGQLELVERQQLLAPEVCAPIRQQTVAVLDEVREELRRLQRK